MPRVRFDIRSYFLLCGLTLSVLLPALHALVGKHAISAETADLSVFCALILYTAAAMLCADVLVRPPERNAQALIGRRGGLIAGSALLVVLMLSVGTVTPFHPFEDIFWFGYGKQIAALSAIAIPIATLLFRSPNRLVHIVMAVATYALALVFYLPSIVQPPWGLIDLGHSLYVLNEVLAPQQGGYPLINFTAQYTSLLGYVFRLLPYGGRVDDAVWFLTLLAVATVIVALVPVQRAYPSHRKYLPILFTVPAIFIVKANEDRYSGSLSLLLSALPVRLIFPAVIALILPTRGVRDAKLGTIALLAFVSSLGILNNLESGIVATIAAGTVIVLSAERPLRVYRPALFVLSLVLSLITQVVILRIVCGEVQFARLLPFVGGFGAGFGSVEMPSFGLWVFVFVFLALGAIVASLHFRLIYRTGAANSSNDEWRLGAIVLFWSAFGLGMAPYYINRSVVSGQLQFLLFPMFIAAAALLPLLNSYVLTSRGIVFAIAALPCAVSLASIVQHPSLELAMVRLRQDGGPSAFFNAKLVAVNEKVAQIRASAADARIGLYMDFGFIPSGVVSLPSYLPVNSRHDLQLQTETLYRHQCALLRRDRNRFLISDLPLQHPAIDMLGDCGYAVTDRFGSGGDVILLERRS